MELFGELEQHWKESHNVILRHYANHNYSSHERAKLDKANPVPGNEATLADALIEQFKLSEVAVRLATAKTFRKFCEVVIVHGWTFYEELKVCYERDKSKPVETPAAAAADHNNEDNINGHENHHGHSHDADRKDDGHQSENHKKPKQMLRITAEDMSKSRFVGAKRGVQFRHGPRRGLKVPKK